MTDAAADFNELDRVHYHKAAELDPDEAPDESDRRQDDFEVMVSPEDFCFLRVTDLSDGGDTTASVFLFKIASVTYTGEDLVSVTRPMSI